MYAPILSEASRLISPLLSEQLEDVAITRWDGKISLRIFAEHAGHELVAVIDYGGILTKEMIDKGEKYPR
jgi:hypothetical protein